MGKLKDVAARYPKLAASLAVVVIGGGLHLFGLDLQTLCSIQPPLAEVAQ